MGKTMKTSKPRATPNRRNQMRQIQWRSGPRAVTEQAKQTNRSLQTTANRTATDITAWPKEAPEVISRHHTARGR